MEMIQQSVAGPLEERLRYGSPLHQRILTRLKQRRLLSEREITRRYDDWTRVDEHLQLYMDLSRGARRGDRSVDTQSREMPYERSVVVPVSYSILQVRLTAIMAIFMARQPMIQLKGRGPEDVEPAKLMEMVLAYDLEQTQALLALYAAFQAAEKYGIGVLADSWEEEFGWVTNRIEIPGMSMQQVEQLASYVGIEAVRQVWGVQREYCKIRAVDPFYYWPDPRVPGHDIQEMEFVGDRVFRGFTHLESRSQQNGGTYFNLEAARRLARSGSHGMRGLSQNRMMSSSRFSVNDMADDLDRGVYALDQMEVNLSPREWGLSEERRPQKWRFTTLEDQVIIRAHRCPYQHEQFSYGALQPNYDGFSNFCNGVIEDLDGLQRMTNWLFNSHFENVRRFLNDSFIYSPQWIEEDDLLNPGAARHIRITDEAVEDILSGRLDPTRLIHQLPLSDVTRQHMQEMDKIFDLAQRMTGVNDPAMGQPLPGRRTLGEVENVIFSSSRRMALSAQLYDMQAITPMTKRMVSNRQQFMSEQAFFRVVGDHIDPRAQQQFEINRQQLLGNMDYIPVSGITPPDPARFSETWIQLLQVMTQLPPEIMMGYDLGMFVQEIAKGLGVTNIERFKIQMAPDEQVLRGVEAGDYVPVATASAALPASPMPAGAM